MNLKDQIAVVFAASGAIAGAVAESLAQHGAKVYVSGRRLESVEELAGRIDQAGGWARASVVDAMDEAAIDAHLRAVIAEQGRLDVVFNGIGIRPLESGYGTPTTDLSYDDFMKPVHAHLGSQFLTSRLAAKHMLAAQSPGTILTLTASLSRIKSPFMAGVTAACTAIEGLSRVMAAEFGRAGIRVICLNPTAMPNTRTIRETTTANARTLGIPVQAMREAMAQSSLLARDLQPRHVGAMAAFLASEAGAVLNSHVVDIDFGTSNVL